jgi:hypothetical protein
MDALNRQDDRNGFPERYLGNTLTLIELLKSRLVKIMGADESDVGKYASALRTPFRGKYAKQACSI